MKKINAAKTDVFICWKSIL